LYEGLDILAKLHPFRMVRIDMNFFKVLFEAFTSTSIFDWNYPFMISFLNNKLPLLFYRMLSKITDIHVMDVKTNQKYFKGNPLPSH
jgi:hypothetical protein